LIPGDLNLLDVGGPERQNGFIAQIIDCKIKFSPEIFCGVKDTAVTV